MIEFLWVLETALGAVLEVNVVDFLVGFKGLFWM